MSLEQVSIAIDPSVDPIIVWISQVGDSNLLTPSIDFSVYSIPVNVIPTPTELRMIVLRSGHVKIARYWNRR